MKNLKVACATPKCRAIDITYNFEEIILEIKKAKADGVELLILPELSLTTAMCKDYFWLDDIKQEANIFLQKILLETDNIYVLIGSSHYVDGKLYNVALLLNNKEIVKVVQKKSSDKYFESEIKFDLEGTKESIYTLKNGVSVGIAFSLEQVVDFSCDVLAVVHSGIKDIVEYNHYCKLLKEITATKNIVIATAMPSFLSSTTDFVLISENSIAKNGQIINRANLFETGQIVADISSPASMEIKYNNMYFEAKMRRPFSDICMPNFSEMFDMQVYSLMQRMLATNAQKVFIGISGGLDSTLALLVTCRCMDKMNRDRKNVVAITLPCFGTSKRTKSNAEILSTELMVDFRIIDIKDSILEHFKAIDHQADDYDVAYENSQARERTQVLMDIANKENGIMLGTGDLSELALGWTTYSGDHMSNYAINASIPKTLMQDMICKIARQETNQVIKECLLDIVATPISPELLPAQQGEMQQKTENILGPYEFYDFLLYYGIYLKKGVHIVYNLANEIFGNELTGQQIKEYMKRFYTRFVSQQFKRSCLPDGPLVTFFSLSPREGFKIPSDASARVFLDIIDSIS